MANELPHGLIAYGPNENCTLEICPVKWSVLQYQPSLAANGIFIALFAISGIIHIYQGWRWQMWGFMAAMLAGCIDEIIGYVGRILLHYNPFGFNPFIMQIVTITIGPVFYCAAIYVTISQIVYHLGRQYSRFDPRLFYLVFIVCDVISLILQATGGAMSSQSAGANDSAINIALAGLSFQVATLVVFIACAVDYFIRYGKAESLSNLSGRFKYFLSMLSLAILLILTRCAYRIDELSVGYFGPLIHDEPLFIVLEGVMIIVAVFVLNLGHPGLVFGKKDDAAEAKMEEEKESTV